MSQLETIVVYRWSMHVTWLSAVSRAVTSQSRPRFWDSNLKSMIHFSLLNTAQRGQSSSRTVSMESRNCTLINSQNLHIFILLLHNIRVYYTTRHKYPTVKISRIFSSPWVQTIIIIIIFVNFIHSSFMLVNRAIITRFENAVFIRHFRYSNIYWVFM